MGAKALHATPVPAGSCGESADPPPPSCAAPLGFSGVGDLFGCEWFI